MLPVKIGAADNEGSASINIEVVSYVLFIIEPVTFIIPNEKDSFAASYDSLFIVNAFPDMAGFN